jgi:macrolide transport system ATP-binding/permease protein
MSWLNRRKDTEQQLDDEVRYHIQRLTKDYIRAGMTPADARRRALMDFGGAELAKEECRDVSWWQTWDQFQQDLRYALRGLRRAPVFALAAVMSLALAIGANTAIFNLIDALMLRKLPVRNPSELVQFRRWAPGRSDPIDVDNYQYFEKYRGMTDLFTGMAAINMVERSDVIVGSGGDTDPGNVMLALVSGTYFSTLGVDAAIGRTFTAEDDRVPGGHPIVVVSHAYWKRRLGGTPDVIGRTLTFSGMTYTVVGVAPPAFTGDYIGKPVDLWIPILMQAQAVPESNGLRRLAVRIVARMRPGVRPQQARGIVAAVRVRLEVEAAGAASTQLRRPDRFELISAAAGFSPLRDGFGPALRILAVLAGIVLVIACANIANLLLARSGARQREMAVRLAVGASRHRIVRQLLTESVLLSALGSSLGIWLAYWAASSLLAVASSAPVIGQSGRPPALIVSLTPDWRVLGFTLFLCLSTGILFGLAPAFRGSRISLSPALIGRGVDAGTVGGRFTLSKILIVAEVALSLVLLIGAGLFTRSLRKLQTEDIGVDGPHLLQVWTAPGRAGRRGPALSSFYRTARERLAALPGVVSVAGANSGFLTGYDGGIPSEQVIVPGRAPKQGLMQFGKTVAPGFFETAGARLLVGREFTERDTERGAPPVTVVNQTIARFYFSGEDAIGQHINGMQIVGVVGDVIEGTMRARRGVTYVPYHQDAGISTLCLIVRASGNPSALKSSIRQELRGLDAAVPIVNMETIDESLGDLLSRDRLLSALAGFFAVVAAVLACLGLYGVISYATTRRTKEIGVRLALGASRAQVVTMVLTENLCLAAAGILIGIPTAVAVVRLSAANLFGISATDPFAIVGATLLLAVAAACGVLIPACRAAGVDPMTALRDE